MKKILQIIPLPANMVAVARVQYNDGSGYYEPLNSQATQRCCILALLNDDNHGTQSVEPLVWNNELHEFRPVVNWQGEEFQIVSRKWLEAKDSSQIHFNEL